MFWKKSSFYLENVEDMQTFAVKDLFEDKPFNAGWDSMNKINELMECHDELRMVTKEKIGQVLQVATLAVTKHSCKHLDSQNEHTNDSRPERIVLANTHLFYHPMADHIRTMQTYAICMKLDQIRHKQKPSAPIIFAGDLNSCTRSGAVHLLSEGTVQPKHPRCWRFLNSYQWEGSAEDTDVKPIFDRDETAVPPSVPTISLSPSFPVLALGCTEMPDFTNFAKGFIETLDYIFVSTPSKKDRFGFRSSKSAPMPSRDLVSQYVAMPNEFMPSDHVAVACDLKWQRYEGQK